MRIKSQKDFYSGLLFLTLGGGFAWGATGYRLGSAASMGPGYFPLLLGMVLAFLGSVIMFKALVIETEDGEKIGRWAFKPLFYVIAANVLFGVLLGGLPSLGLPSMGLVIAIYGLTLVASLAGDDFRLLEAFGLGSVLAAGSYLAFVYLLKLQFPVWPEFITG